MSFPQKIKDDLMVASARHCNVCHKHKGVKLEIHHIIPKKDGGEDTCENGIVLCFDCHADAGHYFAKHPKGTKFSPTELKKHKENWFKKVIQNNISVKNNAEIRVLFDNGSESITIHPIFERVSTKFKCIDELKNIDYKKIVPDNSDQGFFGSYINRKIKTFDDFVDYLNGDLLNKYSKPNPEKEANPQPTLFEHSMHGTIYSYSNLSVGRLKFKIINETNDAIDNPKLRLNISHLTNTEVVDSRKEFFDPIIKSNISIESSTHATIEPNATNVLLPMDYIESGEICFKPDHEKHSISINWDFYSRTTVVSGKLIVNIDPFYEEIVESKYVKNPGKHNSTTVYKRKLKF